MVGNPISIPDFAAEKGPVGKEIALSILPSNHRDGGMYPHYLRAQCQAQPNSRKNHLGRSLRAEEKTKFSLEKYQHPFGDGLLCQVNNVDKMLVQLGVCLGPFSVAV